jgi:hypothetical protein
MDYTTLSRLALALLCAAAITGCSSSKDSSGSVSISLMDRPVDNIAELWVTITEIWVKPAGDGPAFQLPMTSAPFKANLLALDDQNAAILVNEAVVGAGSYNWIELRIDDSDIGLSYAIDDVGGMQPVDIDVPSDKIRLVSGFTVGENQAVRILFDWDVRKGLTNPVGRNGYILRPAFRILYADELGSISGLVTQATFDGDTSCTTKQNPNEGNVVYVFAAGDTPDDIDGMDAEPVTTADAVLGISGGYDYRAAVMPGTYTVAFTCLGATDTDNGNEDLQFIRPLNTDPIEVTLSAEVTGVNF